MIEAGRGEWRPPSNAPRTTIRPATREDLPDIERWYREAAAAVLGIPEAPAEDTLQRRFDEAGGQLLLIARADSPEAIGLLGYRAAYPADGWLTITFLAMAAGHRGWGHGSEAVRLLEAEHAAAHYLAEVAPRNGLGVYFWLRVGYHPAHFGEVFWRAPGEGGTMAMVRDAGA